MPPTRIYCAAEGFERNWIEIDGRFTRREVEKMYVTDASPEYIDLLRSKTVGVHIELESGEVIDSPDKLTYDALLDADEIVLGWIGYALPLAVTQRRALGNASVRLSSNSSGIAARKLLEKGPTIAAES